MDDIIDELNQSKLNKCIDRLRLAWMSLKRENDEKRGFMTIGTAYSLLFRKPIDKEKQFRIYDLLEILPEFEKDFPRCYEERGERDLLVDVARFAPWCVKRGYIIDNDAAKNLRESGHKCHDEFYRYLENHIELNNLNTHKKSLKPTDNNYLLNLKEVETRLDNINTKISEYDIFVEDMQKQLNTINGAKKCKDWLVQLMKDSMKDGKMQKPTKTKTEYRIEARAKFSISIRAFDREWKKAIEESGATQWSSPGRKS